jgi:hypothetical protein
MSAETRKLLLKLSSNAVDETDDPLDVESEERRERIVGKKLESAPWAVRLPISYC